MKKRTTLPVACWLLVSLVMSACGGESTPTNTPATTASRVTTSAISAAAQTTAAIPAGATLVQANPSSKEVRLLKTAVPHITATLDALKKGDINAARSAFKEYSYTWNGIEVYVNSRSRQLYDTIEVQNEFKANDLFDKPGSKAEEIIPLVEGVQKGFVEAIKMAESGPAYNAVLDEIADLRIVKIDLSRSIAALAIGDMTAARTSFEKFNLGWDNIEGSVKPRSKELYKETEKMLDRVVQLYKSDKPVPADLTEAENRLLTTYNRSITMLNTLRTSGKAPTKEVILLQGITPSISATLAALKKGEVKAAWTLFQDYSYGWNGIEVYVKTRSAQLYDTIEVQNEFKANDLFIKPDVKAEEIIPLVEGVQKGYNEAINLAINGQPLSPILDEVADMRILRIQLKKSIAALTDNKLEPAKVALQEFSTGWVDVGQLVSSRNKEVFKDIDDRLNKTGQLLLRSDKPAMAEAVKAMDELQTSYNNGLKLLTDALSSGSK